MIDLIINNLRSFIIRLRLFQFMLLSGKDGVLLGTTFGLKYIILNAEFTKHYADAPVHFRCNLRVERKTN